MPCERTAAAVEASKTYAAERHAADPVKLDRAVRIVRAALAQQRVTLADLKPAAKR